ncbi:MAG: hypothetical protein HZA35_01675 [Parcubacteria group bacterium]|nr:hypothetical protein [Parcubacteria group bacterium]
MKKGDIVRAILEAGIWYVFTWYLLYVLKNPVELWFAALVLLVLMYAGVLICPWVRYTSSWRRMVGKE